MGQFPGTCRRSLQYAFDQLAAALAWDPPGSGKNTDVQLSAMPTMKPIHGRF
jgi:hypothetical protein